MRTKAMTAVIVEGIMTVIGRCPALHCLLVCPLARSLANEEEPEKLSSCLPDAAQIPIRMHDPFAVVNSSRSNDPFL